MNKDIIIIGICGYARTGKDTFAKIAKKELEKIGYKCYIFNLAEDLKNISNKITKKYLNLDCFELESDLKSKLRPLMVGVGESFRNIDEKYWIKNVSNKIDKIKNKNKCVVIIPDLRFQNEVEWINSYKNSFLINITRKGIKPPNDQEKINIPKLIKSFNFITIKWENIDCFKENILTNPKIIDIVIKTLRRINCIKK